MFSTDPLADNSQQGVFGQARLSGIGAKAIASRKACADHEQALFKKITKIKYKYIYIKNNVMGKKQHFETTKQDFFF